MVLIEAFQKLSIAWNKCLLSLFLVAIHMVGVDAFAGALVPELPLKAEVPFNKCWFAALVPRAIENPSNSSNELSFCRTSLSPHWVDINSASVTLNCSKSNGQIESIDGDSNQATAEKKPVNYWYITWTLAGLSAIFALTGLIWAIYIFKVQSRKSIYDDFWFREIFFKKLSAELIEFRKKWHRAKCQKMKDTLGKSGKKLIKEYLSDLAILRDIANPIEVLSPSARIKFEEAIDMLEEIPSSDDPEILYGEALSCIHKQAFKIHKDMEKKKYKFDFFK